MKKNKYPILFRAYKSSDFHEVEKMLNLLSKVPLRSDKEIYEIHRKIINYPQNHRFVGVLYDEIVCHGVCIFDLKIRGDICCHLEDIVVKESMQRKGIGKLLITYLVEFAKKNNCYKITTTTQENNRKFYESCGLSLNGIEMRLLLK